MKMTEGSLLASANSESCEDECSRAELHEMLIPAALIVPETEFENPVILNFYFISLIPDPEDRLYQKFGLFVKAALPREAEQLELDLHLDHSRIVKTKLVPSGVIEFSNDEISEAEKFQEMFLKIILDRSNFFSDFVPLGKNDSSQPRSSTFYLLLPVREHEHRDVMTVDWNIIRRCLSSPVFKFPTDAIDNGLPPACNSLQLKNGPESISNIMNSLVFTPHNKLFFFIDDILPGTNGYNKKFKSCLKYPEQHVLKAKQLFSLRNLLLDRKKENTVAREKKEHFMELPPELCSLKIIGFSKDMGSSLSLLPSIMHRLENLLVAIELKNMLSASFPEGSEVTARRVLEALTTEKCSERFSLERLEVLGDAFLKYVVGRHLFLLSEALDEGQLTMKRSSIVNNSHLCELATRSNLQVYIRDQPFDPYQFFALGRPCTVICNKDRETSIHSPQKSRYAADEADASDVRCSRCHHWLYKKTIADVLEALIGAYIIDSGGFKAATAFLRWIGIQVDFEVSQVSKFFIASKSYMSLSGSIDIAALERKLGYKFQHKGLLLQAFVHPSYNGHLGGYQRLEFLGDAVLDYLIISYLYSVYPNLKPGQLTDLKSLFVNNNSFARIAVFQSFHEYLICGSSSLSEAIVKFVSFVHTSDSEKGGAEGPQCPKVLGDLVESCVGAILLDSGFNLNHVWRLMLYLLDPIMSFSSLQVNPIRDLQELCDSHNWGLQFHSSNTGVTFLVKAVVTGENVCSTGCANNISKKVAKEIAAQQVFFDLKAQGYQPKNKTEKFIKSSLKQEAKLIGYNESSIAVVVPDSIELENLKVQDTPLPASDCTPNIKAIDRQLTSSFEAPGGHHSETSEDISSETSSLTTGVSYRGSAKSCLYEICAANYWKHPLFECYEEERPDHIKSFTFKVIVEIEALNMVVECFGAPQENKKAAAEHAAEGALWYLQHQGYLPKGKD